MAATLCDALNGALRPSLLGAAGALLDEPDIGVRKGLETSIAAILGGLVRSSGEGKLMGDVTNLVASRETETAALSDPMALLNAGPQSGSAARGNRLLHSLFGDRQGGIVRAIARASGISNASAATLFGLAAPMVLDQLGRRTSTQGASPGAIAALLSSESDPILSSVPPYLRPQIGIGRPAGQGLLDGTLEGGLRSLTLLAVPLLCVLAIFWYVLPPIEGHMDVTVPDKPPMIEGKIEYKDDWRRDAPSPAPKDEGSAKPDEGSRTWTSPSASSEVTPPATPTPSKAPPIAGLVRTTLPDGVDIDVVPYGLEQKVVAFTEDRFAAIDKARWFEFDRLRFLTGSTDLTPGSRAQLRNVAKIMKAYPSLRVKIGGYTDNLGSPESNMRLSEGRAKSAMNQLVKLGVAADRLEAEGYGEQHPVADNATPEGRAKNRRTALSVRAK